MRNIKFRLWDELAGEITLVKTMHFYEENGSLMGVESVDDDVVYFEEEFEKRCSLMQYTGLKDKNGVEIFEGDIVTTSVPMIMDKNLIVTAYEKGGCFLLSGSNTSVNLINVASDSIQVIGNIYENKELLEEK